MSLRLEMLQAARLAPRLLRDSSELVRDFVLSRHLDDGGFADRDGSSDPYYTVFGVECLIALQADVPREKVHQYLAGLLPGPRWASRFLASRALASLDLVHLAGLVRVAASSDWALDHRSRAAIERAITKFRTPDGGYHNSRGEETGTAYGCFLAVGALQDLGVTDIDSAGIGEFLAALRTPDGGYGNQRRVPSGTTTAAAAAIAVSRNLALDCPTAVGDWLVERCRRAGGFCATPLTPAPDLLSTATALHALAGLQRSFDDIREPCLDFIDTLWSSEGGFYGHWADEVLDCEYTYYGLLALGHLAVG